MKPSICANPLPARTLHEQFEESTRQTDSVPLIGDGDRELTIRVPRFARIARPGDDRLFRAFTHHGHQLQLAGRLWKTSRALAAAERVRQNTHEAKLARFLGETAHSRLESLLVVRSDGPNGHPLSLPQRQDDGSKFHRRPGVPHLGSSSVVHSRGSAPEPSACYAVTRSALWAPFGVGEHSLGCV